MAILRIPDENLVVKDEVRVKERLAAIGIGYERWPIERALRDDSSAEEVLVDDRIDPGRDQRDQPARPGVPFLGPATRDSTLTG